MKGKFVYLQHSYLDKNLKEIPDMWRRCKNVKTIGYWKALGWKEVIDPKGRRLS